MQEAEQIAQNRRMNSLTLNLHTEILEVLEIPQLMDTCVRNSYYEEALELVSYVRRLEKKHATIPVIQVQTCSEPGRCQSCLKPYDDSRSQPFATRVSGPEQKLSEERHLQPFAFVFSALAHRGRGGVASVLVS